MITEFPRALLNIPTLRSINLANNNIKEISKNIHKLINLENLNSTCNVTSVISNNIKILPKTCEISLNKEGISFEVRKFLSEIQDRPEIYIFPKHFKSFFE